MKLLMVSSGQNSARHLQTGFKQHLVTLYQRDLQRPQDSMVL